MGDGTRDDASEVERNGRPAYRVRADLVEVGDEDESMSYDVHLEIDTGGEYPAVVGDSLNYTWNMGYAIRHGGIEMYRREDDGTHTHNGDGRFILDGAPARAAATALADCIATIERDAEALRKHEPDNGWGSVDRVVAVFLRPILDMCRAHPNATVKVS